MSLERQDPPGPDLVGSSKPQPWHGRLPASSGWRESDRHGVTASRVTCSVLGSEVQGNNNLKSSALRAEAGYEIPLRHSSAMSLGSRFLRRACYPIQNRCPEKERSRQSLRYPLPMT